MSDTSDRPNERSERVPLSIPIELGHGDFEDSFEADGVNLSKGGLSMRAACLPDPGSRLSLRFRCEPSGRVVSAQGEVVWAHLDGEQRGEFGLAFVDLDPQTEWLIEEMIADHGAAQDGGARRGEQPSRADEGPRIAQLELEGSSEPIAARVVSADGDRVVFEQRLDLLKLGRGVRAYGDGEQAHAGAIYAVELRMVGSVPMLAVTVAFDDAEAGVPLGAPEHEHEHEPEHDTEPDLAAPAAAAAAVAEAIAHPNPTLVEFHGARRQPAPLTARDSVSDPAWDTDADSGSDSDCVSGSDSDSGSGSDSDSRSVTDSDSYSGSDLGRDAGFAVTAADLDVHERPTFDPTAQEAQAILAARSSSAPRITRARVSEPPIERRSQPAPSQLEPTVVVATEPRRPPAPAPTREWSTGFTLDDRSADPEPSAEPEQLELPPFEPEPPALQVALGQLWRLLRRQAVLLASASRTLFVSLYRSASPEVRAHVLRAGGAVSGLYDGRIGPQLGAMRRLVLGRLGARPRRKTSSPQAAGQPGARAGLGRTVLIGALAAGAIGFGVYALAPASDDAPQLHRALDPSVTTPGGAPSPVSSTAAVDLIGATPLVAPDPKHVPNAHAVPASSPFAVDVRDKPSKARKAVAAPAVVASPAVAATTTAAVPASAAGSATRKLRFGAASAPRGRRFALRMSGKIQTLSGSEDPGGFSVHVAGCLALDRAGPIASAHSAVERSMVINRGDHAELTIRFDQGKRPAYQVVAEGSTLYVTIQDL
jgi:hypothetical protein